MKLILQLFFCLFAAIMAFPIQAQWRDVVFDELGQKDGFLARGVYDIIQDSTGYIYFGTELGLVRYDGSDFEYFRHDPKDTNSISDGHVRCLAFDLDGFIWMGLSGGIDRFDPRQASFVHYQIKDFPYEGNEIRIDISSISIDGDNYLWLGGSMFSLHRFTKSTGIIKSYFPEGIEPLRPHERESWRVFSVLQDIIDKNILWLGVNEMGMIRFNKKSEEFWHSSCLLGFPAQGRNGIFYSGTWDMGLASYDPGTQECNYTSLGPSYPEIPDISQLHSSEVLHVSDGLWLAASHGIIEFDNDGNQKRLFFDYENDRINRLFRDRNNNIWAGPWGGPIKVMNPRSQHFRFFSLNSFEATTRYYPSWQVYDEKEDRFLAAAFSRKRIYSIQNSSKKQQLNKIIQTNFRIRGLAADNDDQIWVASDFALYILQRGTDRLIEFKNESLKRAGLAALKIRMVDTDHHGNLCIMGETGFMHFNIRTGKTSIAPINSSSTGDLLWDFSTDATGNVWLTTHESIIRFNPYDDSFREYSGAPSITANKLRSTVIASDSTLWTVGNTLEHFKLQGDSLTHISNPILSDALRGIGAMKLHVDRSGRIWTFSQNGLHCFEPSTMEHRSYGLDDGLDNVYLDPQQCANLPDGSILTHGGTGIMIFNPDSVWQSGDASETEIAIHKVRISGKDLMTDKDPNQISRIELNPGQKYLEIYYRAMIFPRANGITYSYKIEGLSDEWIFHNKNESVTLAGLSPGNYSFMVKAGNPDATTRVKTMDIYISAPFYAKWWFILISIASIMVVIFAIYRNRINRILKEEALKTSFNKKIAEVELQALRAQMNPHFMFNSLNSIKSYILVSGPLQAAEYLTNFATLIRAILHNSREKEITLEKEIEALLLYIDLEKMRFPDRFDFVYKHTQDLDLEDVMIPPLVLQPYVENAIWHGLMHKSEKGVLTLSIERIGDMLECSIEDNGIGRTAALELRARSTRNYKSMGMGITKDRIEIHNKMHQLGIAVNIEDKNDKEGNALGTKVTISIPNKLIE